MPLGLDRQGRQVPWPLGPAVINPANGDGWGGAGTQGDHAAKVPVRHGHGPIKGIRGSQIQVPLRERGCPFSVAGGRGPTFAVLEPEPRRDAVEHRPLKVIVSLSALPETSQALGSDARERSASPLKLIVARPEIGSAAEERRRELAEGEPVPPRTGRTSPRGATARRGGNPGTHPPAAGLPSAH